MKTVSLILLVFPVIIAAAQPKKYSTANAHSHNDYENAIPFYLAYQNGFGSIEADVFLVNDTLFVAHNRQDIRAGRTLRNLYLQPLLHALDSSKAKMILLVDVKDDYKLTLPALINELQPIRKYLASLHKKNAITIVVSGNRPMPADYNNYPDYIFFDDDLRLTHTPVEWKRVGLVSLQFARLSHWNGKDELKKDDSLNLKRTIDSVHKAGKRIRLWAAPDNEASWKLQETLRVDLIGTDKISDLAQFLRRRKNT
jgi:alkaline phosphatase